MSSIHGPSAADPGAVTPITDATSTPAASGLVGGQRFHSMPAPSGPFWIALIGGVVAAVILLLTIHALFVFAMGIALAFFLVPVVNWLVRKGVPRVGASIMVVIAVVLISIVLFIFVVSILIDQGVKLITALPTLLDQLQDGYAGADLPTWLREVIDAVVATIAASLEAVDWGAVIIGFIQGAAGMIGSIFALMLLPFFLFYLLKDQPRMAGGFYAKVPGPWKEDVGTVVDFSIQDFVQYFKAEVIVGAIMGVTVAIGMTVIGAIVGGPLGTFAILLGLIAAVMELIPQIGPILSYLPALFLALSTSPEAVVLVSVFYFIAFNIEGSVLVPTFQGRMISFSGATVLFIIALGFALAGIIGAILALPVAAIARDIFSYLFEKTSAASLEGSPAPLDVGPDVLGAGTGAAPA